MSDFLSDTQQIGRGVVIGQPGAAELLEANKRAYFDRFVSTQSFMLKNLPLTPSGYVSALNGNAGSPLTQSERDALVAGLTNGTETRATVLRKIVENDNFKRAQFNRAFVLSKYFGYLRRNPFDPPDNGDISGYVFWLSKLDQFNGDYRRAEMVKAFLAASEYRKRFGN